MTLSTSLFTSPLPCPALRPLAVRSASTIPIGIVIHRPPSRSLTSPPTTAKYLPHLCTSCRRTSAALTVTSSRLPAPTAGMTQDRGCSSSRIPLLSPRSPRHLSKSRRLPRIRSSSRSSICPQLTQHQPSSIRCQSLKMSTQRTTSGLRRPWLKSTSTGYKVSPPMTGTHESAPLQTAQSAPERSITRSPYFPASSQAPQRQQLGELRSSSRLSNTSSSVTFPKRPGSGLQMRANATTPPLVTPTPRKAFATRQHNQSAAPKSADTRGLVPVSELGRCWLYNDRRPDDRFV